jgi:hypothetical protein
MFPVWLHKNKQKKWGMFFDFFSICFQKHKVVPFFFAATYTKNKLFMVFRQKKVEKV